MDALRRGLAVVGVAAAGVGCQAMAEEPPEAGVGVAAAGVGCQAMAEEPPEAGLEVVAVVRRLMGASSMVGQATVSVGPAHLSPGGAGRCDDPELFPGVTGDPARRAFHLSGLQVEWYPPALLPTLERQRAAAEGRRLVLSVPATGLRSEDMEGRWDRLRVYVMDVDQPAARMKSLYFNGALRSCTGHKLPTLGFMVEGRFVQLVGMCWFHRETWLSLARTIDAELDPVWLHGNGCGGMVIYDGGLFGEGLLEIDLDPGFWEAPAEPVQAPDP